MHFQCCRYSIRLLPAAHGRIRVIVSTHFPSITVQSRYTTSRFKTGNTLLGRRGCAFKAHAPMATVECELVIRTCHRVMTSKHSSVRRQIVPSLRIVAWGPVARQAHIARRKCPNLGCRVITRISFLVPTCKLAVDQRAYTS